MATTLGMLRKRVLAPALNDVTFARRGFPVIPSDATGKLEAVPQSVVVGFEWAIEARNQWETERRLELVTPEHLGFAYEGATMACVVRDAMAGGRPKRTGALLRGPAAPHIFLAYIGIGFAMARLPRILWGKVLPDLPDNPYHPVMSWLAVDGYAFDRAYFDTRRWVDEQYVPPAYPWQGRPEYFRRAADQGVGRALWFIHGGNPAAAAAEPRLG
jgi:enediyne biosynthesis protein E2